MALRAYLLNGEPVEVDSRITINFTLSERLEMSTMHNKTHATPDSHLGAFLKVTHVLLLIVAGWWIAPCCTRVRAVYGSAKYKDRNILGTVVDINDDPVPDATVVLQGPAGTRLAAVTKDDGCFAFHDVTPGIVYQITVTAEGFAEWSSSVTVEPGQDKTVTDIKLRILAVQRALTVSYSSKEVAAQQLKAEEQQRIFRFIPNLYVVYDPHRRTSYREDEVPSGIQRSYHPFSSSVELLGRASSRPMTRLTMRQGAEGYGRRMGAGLAEPLRRTCSATLFCHRSCIRTLAISTRAPVQNGLGLATPS